MNSPLPAAPPEAAVDPPRRRAVAALRHAIETSDPGTVAALRRVDPTSPPPAFYRVTVGILDDYLPEAGRRRDALETGWAVVVAAIATAQPRFLSGTPLGKALAEARVAAMRVLRLLEANEAQLPDLVRNVVHQLVQKGQAFDPNDLADLVLTAGTDRARSPRRRIARDFYRHIGT